MRQGDWKLVSAKLGRWELFNLAKDRTETNDLSAEHPERVVVMSKEWFRIAENVDRLKGKQLGSVGDALKQLNFRKKNRRGGKDSPTRKGRKSKEK